MLHQVSQAQAQDAGTCERGDMESKQSGSGGAGLSGPLESKRVCPGQASAHRPGFQPDRATGWGLWHAACGSLATSSACTEQHGACGQLGLPQDSRQPALATLQGRQPSHSLARVPESAPLRVWAELLCLMGEVKPSRQRQAAAGWVAWGSTAPFPKAGQAEGQGCRSQPTTMSQVSNNPTPPRTAK